MGPLSGVRIVELGHAVAGPFACAMLADFGAEVIKIERPQVGDSLRSMGPELGGQGVWWSVAARNKRSVCIDMKRTEGRELVRDLVCQSDMVIENFRPGVLERAGLGWEVLHSVHPTLIMIRISGFGQIGPHSKRGGFGKIAEAFSGATYLTGHRNEPPVHPGYSLGDSATGLMGAFAAMLALRERDNSGRGQEIDLALYEPLMRMIEWQFAMRPAVGEDALRNGTAFPFGGAFLTDICRTRDRKSVVVSAATTDSLQNLKSMLLDCSALESPDATEAEVARALRAWVSSVPLAAALDALESYGVVAGVVNSASDLADDAHVHQRENVITVPVNGTQVPMPSVVPRLAVNPGAVRWPGPTLGEHTSEVLTDVLSISREQVATLRRDGVIS